MTRLGSRTALAVLFVVTGTGIALVRFRCSPLYPAFNDVNSDVYVYQAVGNSWLHGLLPYRDVYDVKGPFLVLLFGLFARLQPWSMGLPLAFLAVLAASSVWLAYAIARLHLARAPLAAVAAVVSCALIYLSVARVPTSFTCEELAVPGVLLLLWLVSRWLGGSRVSSRWWFLDGLILGALFWTKYQVIAPWVAMLVGLTVVVACRRLAARDLARVVCWHLAGVAAASVVILPFFLPVLAEMLRAYFLAKLGSLDLTHELLAQAEFVGAMLRDNLAVALTLVSVLVLLVLRALGGGSRDGLALTIAFGLSLWASVALVRHTNNSFVPLAFCAVAVPQALAAPVPRLQGWVAGFGATALAVAACAAPLSQAVGSYGLLQASRSVTCYQLPSLARSTYQTTLSAVFARTARDRPILSLGTLFAARSSFVSRTPMRQRFQFADVSWSSTIGADAVQTRHLDERTFDYVWIHISGVDRFHDLETQIASAKYTDGDSQSDQAATLVRNYTPVLSCNNEILLRVR